jgi:FKBP-type peptidyl-prolyl cis-trans isomerase 2
VVTTSTVSSITQTTATCGGNVTDDGGAEVTGKGVCWNISENPTTSNSKTSDGTGIGTFTSNLTSLTPATKYYVRAYATNSEGTGYGSQVNFTTSEVLLATVQTASVSSITGTTAVSGGSITSDGGGAITAKGVCWSTTANPTTSNDKTNDGTGTSSFTSNITGLTPSSSYHVRAYAINSAGTAYGNDLPFTAIGGKAYATTSPASDVTSTSTTLKGTVSANYISTTVTFEYGKTTSYGQTIAATPGTVTGNDYTDVHADLTGLETGATYHYRIKAVNAAGTTYGSDSYFTTSGSKPYASVSYPSDITESSATLKGTVAACYSSTTVTFEYGKTAAYGLTANATPGTVTGGYYDYTDVSSELSGLDVGTTYHFRVKAVNAFGTTYSSDQSFITLGGKPYASVSYPSDITESSATLKGTVAACYSSTTVTFEYGKTTTYGQTAAATPGTVTGGYSDYTDVYAEISGLDVGTTYHFRVKAVNAFGTTYSSDQTFITLGGKPYATTSYPADITSSGATLKGTVAACYSSTTVTFEYGTTTTYGQTANATPGTVTGGYSDYTEVIASISGLAKSTTYHFRVKAVNSLGTTYSSDQSFSTSGK